jgi:hypothetical protein
MYQVLLVSQVFEVSDPNNRQELPLLTMRVLSRFDVIMFLVLVLLLKAEEMPLRVNSVRCRAHQPR